MLVHGYVTGAAWAGILGAWKAGLPVIMRGDTHGRRRPSSLRASVMRVLMRPLMGRVDGVLAIGTWNEEYWLRRGASWDKVVVSLFAVDNDFFSRGGESRRHARGPCAPSGGHAPATRCFSPGQGSLMRRHLVSSCGHSKNWPPSVRTWCMSALER